MIHFLNFRKKLYIGSIWQTPDKNPRTFTSAIDIIANFRTKYLQMKGSS